MRFSIVALTLFGLVASVTAQIPNCAMNCMANADTDPCIATDNACLCRNENFITTTTQCILLNCQGDELETALAAAQEVCRSVGVTLTSTPPLPTPTSDTGSGSDSSDTGSSASDTGTADDSQNTDSAGVAIKINTAAGLVAVGLAALAL